MFIVLFFLGVLIAGLLFHIMRLRMEAEELRREMRTLHESEAWLIEELNRRVRSE